MPGRGPWTPVLTGRGTPVLNLSGFRPCSHGGGYACTRSSGRAASSTGSRQGETIYVERLRGRRGRQGHPRRGPARGGRRGRAAGRRAAGRPRPRSWARCVEHGRDHKIRVFKYKKRKHYRRTRGHRQGYTAVRIDSIQSSRAASAQASGSGPGQPLQVFARLGTMAHKKGQGSSRNGRDSNSQRLGRQALRRRAGAGRDDHPAPARHEVEAGQERRAWPRTTRCSPWWTASSGSRITARAACA